MTATGISTYIDGNFVSHERALVSVEQRGFRFGDGVFTTVRITTGRPYQWAFHVERLRQGLEALRIGYEVAQLVKPCREMVARNRMQDGLLRIYISRGIGGRGYLPTDCVPCVVIESLPLPEAPEEPVNLWLSRWRKTSPEAMPVSFKLAQGVGSTLAKMEAEEHGCFDSIQLSERGMIAEASGTNIFWCKDGGWYTPALTTGALMGSARSALMRLLGTVKEVEAPLKALQQAEAVVMCNAAVGAVGVQRLEPQGWRWNNFELADQLREMLRADMREALPFA